MAIIFDGKTFAREKEIKLKEEIKRLSERSIKPKLVSILVGDNPASVMYVKLKKKAAERVGAEEEGRSMMTDVRKEKIIGLIQTLNKDESTHGIMVQLPLPANFSEKDRDEIIKTIAKEKDVDGLREDGLYLTPTVKAVLEVVREATPYITLKVPPLKVAVVGAKGFEGKKIFKVMKEMVYVVEGLDREIENLNTKTRQADILISVTGSPGIIGKEEIKDGAVIIDVGSPKGDVKADEIIDKAAFISPVPGGIGPITISALLENLVEAAI